MTEEQAQTVAALAAALEAATKAAGIVVVAVFPKKGSDDPQEMHVETGSNFRDHELSESGFRDLLRTVLTDDKVPD